MDASFPSIEICVVGGECGKSQFIRRFIYDEYNETYDPTVEDNYSKNDFVVDETSYKLKILDTSGSDSYAELGESWYKRSQAFIMAFSIGDVYTFDKIPYLLESIQKHKKLSNQTPPLILVGLQADIENRVVTEKEGLSLAFRYKTTYKEVSSKRGDGEEIKEIFETLIREIRKKEDSSKFIDKKVKPTKIKESLPLKPGLDDSNKWSQIYVSENNSFKSKKKKWIVLKDGNVFVYNSDSDFTQHKPNITISTLTSTVKPVNVKGKPELSFQCFELVTIMRSYFFDAETKEECQSWTEEITKSIAMMIGTVVSKKEEKLSKAIDKEKTPEEEWRMIQKVDESNLKCVDCQSPEPDWCSINLGILMCIQCSGIHRSLGTHISKVRSLTLDKLDQEVYQLMKCVGNNKANKVWEHKISPSFVRASPRDDRQTKEKWIKAKYVSKHFVKTSSDSEDDLSLSLSKFVSSGDLYNAMLLQAQGASINWANPSNLMKTPLHCASFEDQLVLSVWLVLSNALTDQLDEERMTPLDIALKNNRKQITEWLTKKGAKKSNELVETAEIASPSLEGQEQKPVSIIENKKEKSFIKMPSYHPPKPERLKNNQVDELP